MTFVQAAVGIGNSIYHALHPGTILFPTPRSKPLRQTQISEALVSPGFPLDGYQTCNFQPWKVGQVIYFMLSLVYGTFFPLCTDRTLASDPFSVEDSLALLIIVYSAKRHEGGLARVGGMPSLLEKIRQDATMYFLVLSTGHLLLVLFEVFAPVSSYPVDLGSITHDKIM